MTASDLVRSRSNFHIHRLREIVKVADFRALRGGPDFLRHHLFMSERRDICRLEWKLVKVSLLELRQCTDGQNRLFAQAHLDFDLDALLIAGMGASGVRKETAVRKIPILIFNLEADAVIGLA